jgi:hypothetical protein
MIFDGRVYWNNITQVAASAALVSLSSDEKGKAKKNAQNIDLSLLFLLFSFSPREPVWINPVMWRD